jgi:folate-binding protein YgfZ
MFSQDGYEAIRTGAAVVARDDHTLLSVSGADRATWLQGLVTNDVLALAPGERRYAASLTPQGRMITDLHVVALPDRLLLEVPARLAGALRERLDGLIFTEDARVVDEGTKMAIWGVYGPKAPDVGRSILPEAESRGPKALVCTDSSFGVPGLALYLDRSEPLPASLTALTRTNLDTLDVVRIEAGTPRFLVDMDEQTIPLEAGIEDRAISFTKGCYVGQEVIVRVTTRGHGRVARKLVRLRADDSRVLVPPRSARIVSGDHDVGVITSATYSPGQSRAVALGYVKRELAEPGTKVHIVWDDGRVEATVW